jgi:putative restriction endonuclease
MPVKFEKIRVGQSFSRPQLASLWGYGGYQALARGVVTPRDENIVILFVTEQKQPFQEQYEDKLMGKELQWEGLTDHFAEARMTSGHENSDEIHIFHRERHHSDFIYLGRATVQRVDLGINRPSRFRLRID